MKFTRFTILPAVCAIAFVLGGCNLFLDADARVERAKERLAAHEYRAAVIELRSAIQSDPQHAVAHLMLAKILLQLSDPMGAEQALESAKKAGAPAADVGPVNAELLIEQREFAKLLAKLEGKELTLSPRDEQLYKARAYLGLQRSDEALEAFQVLKNREPQAIDARVGIAQVYLATGRYSAALAELDPVLKPDLATARVLFTRGTVLAARGECAAAIDALQKSQSAMTRELYLREQVSLLAVLAESQLSCGDVAAADATQKQLALLAPDGLLTRILAGRVALGQRDYAKATSELQRAVNAAPEFAVARFLLGAALLAQGNLNQAETQLADVVKRAPDNAEARKLLAQVRLRLGRPDAALQVLDTPESADADIQSDALADVARLELSDDSSKNQDASSDRNRALALAYAQLRAGEAAAALSTLESIESVAGDVRRESGILMALTAVKGVKAAQEQINTWLKKNESVELLNLAATFQSRQADFDGARQYLKRARASKPDDVATLLNSAQVEVTAEKYPEAEGWLQEALKREPNNKAAKLALAQLAVRTGNLALAQQRLQALVDEGSAIAPRLWLARVQIRQGHLADAEKTLQQVNTNEPAALNAVGLVYAEMGRYDDAQRRFRQAATAEPATPQYRLNLSRSQLALGQSASARSTLLDLVRERPTWMPAVSALTLLDIREGRIDEARKRVDELKRARPNDAVVNDLDGDLKMAAREFADAADAYSAAARKQPSASVALKSYRAREMAQAADATTPLELWLKDHPKDASVRLVLAEAYQRRGQPDLAIKEYEALVEAGGADALVLNNLAWVYYEQRDARARATAKRAHEMAPDNPSIADTYGWVLVEAGDVAQGAAVLERALADSKGNPDIAYHHAAALARLGKVDLARDRLQELTSRPGTFASKDEALTLLRKLGAE